MTTDAKNSFGVFQADPTPANAVQLAIDDHCFGAVQDWPFVDQLRKAKERAEAYPALVAALKEVSERWALPFDHAAKRAIPETITSLLRDLGEL